MRCGNENQQSGTHSRLDLFGGTGISPIPDGGVYGKSPNCCYWRQNGILK